MKLLTKNAKLNKSINTFGLALAPAKHSGYNVCKDSGVCEEVCVLWYRGRTVMPNVRKAMEDRTLLFFKQKDTFLKKLEKELSNLNKRHDNIYIRLNVASDLPWERICPEIFEEHSEITFYDYTKTFSRWNNYVRKINFPENYHLTYSWNERSDKRKVNQLMALGGNINMVYNAEYSPRMNTYGKLPPIIKIGTKLWSTIDGDLDDVRTPETDGVSKAVLVRAKMRKDQLEEYINKGFVVDGKKV